MFTADATLAAFFSLIDWIMAVVGGGAVVHLAAPSLSIMAVLSFAALLLLLPKGKSLVGIRSVPATILTRAR